MFKRVWSYAILELERIGEKLKIAWIMFKNPVVWISTILGFMLILLSIYLDPRSNMGLFLKIVGEVLVVGSLLNIAIKTSTLGSAIIEQTVSAFGGAAVATGVSSATKVANIFLVNILNHTFPESTKHLKSVPGEDTIKVFVPNLIDSIQFEVNKVLLVSVDEYKPEEKSVTISQIFSMKIIPRDRMKGISVDHKLYIPVQAVCEALGINRETLNDLATDKDKKGKIINKFGFAENSFHITPYKDGRPILDRKSSLKPVIDAIDIQKYPLSGEPNSISLKYTIENHNYDYYEVEKKSQKILNIEVDPNIIFTQAYPSNGIKIICLIKSDLITQLDFMKEAMFIGDPDRTMTFSNSDNIFSEAEENLISKLTDNKQRDYKVLFSGEFEGLTYVGESVILTLRRKASVAG